MKSMKKIFVILAIVVASVSCNSNKCEVVGALDNFDGIGTICLVDIWNGRAIIDSVQLENNRFHFKNVKHVPTFAQVVMPSGRPISYLFIEKGKVTVSGDYNLGTIKASGTPSNDAFEAMMNRSMKLMSRYRAAVGEGNKAEIEAVEKEHEQMHHHSGLLHKL